MESKRILVIEDEPAMRSGLRDNLEAEGYAVTVAADGADGLAKGSRDEHDLIILDVMLPKMSGFEVCRQLRANGIKTPIIMLTAKGEEADTVLGLEIGADDYITKPFSLRELLARIRTILRRVKDDGVAGVAVRIGTADIDFAAFTALRNGKVIQMTAREFDILRFLWERRNSTVTRDELLKKVWGTEDVSTRTIDNFILKLRQKLEADPADPKLIVTVHGIGYRLIA